MKIQVASDLHLECEAPSKAAAFMRSMPAVADVLVLAGDIVSFRKSWAAREYLGIAVERWQHVVYVPGNHEYYGSAFGARVPEVPELHVLANSSVVIDGVRFAGGTAWFPEPEDPSYNSSLTDYHAITDMAPGAAYDAFRVWALGPDGIRPGDVVVTHHLPSERSVHPQYLGSPLNQYFVAPLDDVIASQRPRLWIHGHTHEPMDYTLGDTRVVANPRGCPGEHKGEYPVVVVSP